MYQDRNKIVDGPTKCAWGTQSYKKKLKDTRPFKSQMGKKARLTLLSALWFLHTTFFNALVSILVYSVRF